MFNITAMENLTSQTPIIKVYEGNNIAFRKEKNVMINATEMAKAFGKRPAKWLELPSTQAFIRSLCEVRKSDITQLVVTQKGNTSLFEQGTWMHEDVALEFARWLSPKFAIWCNDRIKELLTTGSASLNIPKTFAEALRALADEVEHNQRLMQCNQLQTQLIDQQQQFISTLTPKADFCEQVFNYDNLISLSTSCKVLKLPFGRNTLCKRLRGNGVFYSDRNEPKQQYVNAGYFVMRPTSIHKGSADFIVFTTLVTQKGLAYIGYLFGRRPHAEEAQQLFQRGLNIERNLPTANL